MMPIPKCSTCGINYQATTEQQPGLSNKILIKVWICPMCKHKKGVYTKENLEAWGTVSKYERTEKNKNTFDCEDEYDEKQKILGKHEGCGKDCSCSSGSKKECGPGKCSGCNH